MILQFCSVQTLWRTSLEPCQQSKLTVRRMSCSFLWLSTSWHMSRSASNLSQLLKIVFPSSIENSVMFLKIQTGFFPFSSSCFSTRQTSNFVLETIPLVCLELSLEFFDIFFSWSHLWCFEEFLAINDQISLGSPLALALLSPDTISVSLQVSWRFPALQLPLDRSKSLC